MASPDDEQATEAPPEAEAGTESGRSRRSVGRASGRMRGWRHDEAEDGEGEEEDEDADDGEEGVISTATSDGPRLDFALATREGVEVHGLKEGCSRTHKVASFPPVHGGAEGLAWSPDGRWLGLLGSNGSLHVASTRSNYSDTVELAPLGGESGPGIRAFHFSPLGTYAVCYEPPAHAEEQQADPTASVASTAARGANLAIWHLDSGEPKLDASLAQEKAHWPALKWTEDESHCCRLVRDEIQVFDGGNLQVDTPECTIACRGVGAFEVKCGKDDGDAHIAIFVPGRSGEKARCEVHGLGGQAPTPKAEPDDPPTPKASQELAEADSAQMRWSRSGEALLVLASTEVDSSGKSYYGDVKVYFLRTDGSHCSQIGDKKSGPVHDAAWCPTRDEFLLLQGTLPCNMTLHDGKDAKMMLNFGEGRRNTIQWSPLGRFFSLGGLGQLAGDIDFWDCPGKKKMGETRYECCVDFQWSADGRHLLGWTTAPRMRVENRVELFDYTGERILRLDFEELYWASWRPMPEVGFPDRPPSPRKEHGDQKADPKAAAKQQAYRAPHSDGALASRLRAEERGGARTVAQTAEEQVAERLEKKNREKAKAERGAEKTEKVFREVVVPPECTGPLIGKGGQAIRELAAAAGVPLEVKTRTIKAKGKKGAGKGKDGKDGKDKGEESQEEVVRIGPAGPWDDVDKAEEVVRKRLKEIQDEHKSRESRWDSLEATIPSDLVRRFIGFKGADIQQLSRELKAKLRVNHDVEGQPAVVQVSSTGKGDADGLVAKAEQLIKQRLENIQSEVSDEVRVPGELVGGLIGAKGATIKDLERETDMQLKITNNTHMGDGSATVTIGPGKKEAVARARELIETKLESLQSTGGKKGKGKDGKGKGKDRDSDYDRGRWNQGEWDGGQWDKKGKKDGWDGWWEGGGNWWEASSSSGWWNESDWGNDRNDRGNDRNDRNDRRKDDKAWHDDVAPDLPRDENSWASRLKNGGSTAVNGRAQALKEAQEQQQRQEPRRGGDGSSAPAARGGREADSGGGRGATPSEPPAPAVEAAPEEDPIAEFRDGGLKALKSGDLQGAVDWFTKAVRKNPPNDLQSLVGRSEAYFRLKMLHEAFRDASVAVKLHPNNAAGHLRKGLAQKALKQDVFEASLREALRLDPGCQEAKQALGLDKKQQQQKKPPKATPKDDKFDYCAECGDAAELGAIDEADGQWYCKACWMSLLKDEGGGEETPPEPQEKLAAPSPAAAKPAEQGAAPAEENKKPERKLWADEEDGLGDLIDFGSRFVSSVPLHPSTPPSASRGRWDHLAGDRDDRSDRGKSGGKGGKGSSGGGKDRDRRDRDRDRDRGDRDRGDRDRGDRDRGDRDRGGGGRRDRDDDWDRRDEERDRRKGSKGGGGGGKGAKSSGKGTLWL